MDVDKNDASDQPTMARERIVGSDDAEHEVSVSLGEKPGWLTLYAKGGSVFGDMYWPILDIDLMRFKNKGFGNHFMMRFKGQISELNTAPYGPSTTIPQSDLPLQSLTEMDGGKPESCSLNQNDDVTIFFITGHSKE